MMSLDYRAADRQSDTHTAALGRVKRIEQLVHVLTVEADAGIPHHHTHAILRFSFGSDQRLPMALVDTDHRVRGIAEQVQHEPAEAERNRQ